MAKTVAPIVSWMKKIHLPGVLKIEEKNHAWEGWSEKDFVKNLREKTFIGLVAEIENVVVAFTVYDIREKELFVHKFEVAKELETTRSGHVLLQNMKEKAKKFGKSIVAVFPEERASMEKYKFFAKEGFKSALKRNFFTTFDENNEHSYNDGYEFTWNSEENSVVNPSQV